MLACADLPCFTMPASTANHTCSPVSLHTVPTCIEPWPAGPLSPARAASWYLVHLRCRPLTCGASTKWEESREKQHFSKHLHACPGPFPVLPPRASACVHQTTPGWVFLPHTLSASEHACTLPLSTDPPFMCSMVVRAQRVPWQGPQRETPCAGYTRMKACTKCSLVCEVPKGSTAVGYHGASNRLWPEGRSAVGYHRESSRL